MNMKCVKNTVMFVILILCVASHAMATETRYTDDKWHFTLSPLFLWGMNIDGTSQVGPVTAPLDLTFTDDILENLSAVFTVHFEAQKRNWTFFAEYQYVDLDPSVETPAGPNAAIDFQDQMGELGVAYRVATFGINDLEMLGGVRITSQDLDVKIGPGIQLVDVSETWWDGFFGLRIFTHISENWTFIGRGDIGTGGSDFVWNLVGMFDYQFKDWGSVFFGYKWMDYDYESGSGMDRYAYDALQQGILAGLSIHW